MLHCNLQPKPGKLTNISAKRDLNSVESSEDQITDKSNAALDVSESLFSDSSTVQDKKGLPAPNKVMASIFSMKTSVMFQ